MDDVVGVVVVGAKASFHAQRKKEGTTQASRFLLRVFPVAGLTALFCAVSSLFCISLFRNGEIRRSGRPGSFLLFLSNVHPSIETSSFDWPPPRSSFVPSFVRSFFLPSFRDVEITTMMVFLVAHAAAAAASCPPACACLTESASVAMVSSGRAERRLESDAGCGGGGGGGGQTRRSGQRPAEEEAEARQGRLSLLSLSHALCSPSPACLSARSVGRSLGLSFRRLDWRAAWIGCWVGRP